MLLLLPTPTVPLLVALALILSSCLRRALAADFAPERVLLSLADAWLRARARARARARGDTDARLG